MRIPTFINLQYVDEKGWLTPELQNFTDDLNQAMQESLSDDGWRFPQLTTAQITSIAGSQPNGTAWYDITTDEPKMKVAGVVKVIQTV